MTSENCRIIKYLQVYVTGNKKVIVAKFFALVEHKEKKCMVNNLLTVTKT